MTESLFGTTVRVQRLLTLVMLGATSLAAAGQTATSRPYAGGAPIRVGIVPFADATVSGSRSIGLDVGRTMLSEVVHSTDLVPRMLAPDAATKTDALDGEKAVAIGREQNVDLVFMGTVLEAKTEESSKRGWLPSIKGQSGSLDIRRVKATVTLQGELYDVASGARIFSERLTSQVSNNSYGGTAYTTLGSLGNDNYRSFLDSPLGKALEAALADMTKKVAAARRPAREIAGAGSPASPSGAQSRDTERPTANVPLIAGLITVSVVHEQDKGDYETILKFGEIAADSVVYTVSGNVNDRRANVRRRVRKQDLAHAHEWHPRYNEGDPEIYPGTTGNTLSADVLTDLKTKNQTALKASIVDDSMGSTLKGILGGDAGGFGKLLGGASATGHDAMPQATLTRVEPQPVPIPMLVNDSRVDLPAVHARGTLGDEPFEVYILDDPAIPMVLRWRLGESSKRMVRISYPVETASSHLEKKLSTTGRAEVYGIYFDFAKSTIRPESEPVLKEIAEVMAKNPTWKLSVEGHTDSIGGAASNVDLSTRRATAVKAALVDRYRIAAGSLTPAGFGASRPKETNDTLEGRARNRRVELVRQASAH